MTIHIPTNSTPPRQLTPTCRRAGEALRRLSSGVWSRMAHWQGTGSDTAPTVIEAALRGAGVRWSAEVARLVRQAVGSKRPLPPKKNVSEIEDAERYHIVPRRSGGA